MRAYLVLAVACILITGCAGGSGSGGNSPVPPATSEQASKALSNTLTTTTSGRVLAVDADHNVVGWYGESPLTLLGSVSFNSAGASRMSFASTPDFSRVYAAAVVAQRFADNHILELNGTTYTQRRLIPLGPLEANGVAVAPDDTKLYVGTETQGTNPRDSIDVIDVASGKIAKSIPLSTGSNNDSSIEWVAIDHSGSHVYVYSDNRPGNASYHSALTRINTSDDSIAYTKQIGLYSYFAHDARISANDTTIDFIDVNFQTLHSVDAASGSTVATRALGSSVLTGFDDAKSGSAMYVATVGTGNAWQLTTYDSRTLAVTATATVANVQIVSVAASSSGFVYLNEQPAAGGYQIEAVNPTTGAVNGTVTEPTSTTDIFAQ